MTAVGGQGVIFGVTLNGVFEAAAPPSFETSIGPVFAPAGTGTTIFVAVPGVGVAVTPLNFTVAPVSRVPLIVTGVPTAPLAGEKDESVGGSEASETSSK